VLDRVRPADICFVCKCTLDTTAPHAEINFRLAHLDCADIYDSRDLGGIELPERFGDDRQDYADAVCVPLTGEL
jgi:hypothetical protein